MWQLWGHAEGQGYQGRLGTCHGLIKKQRLQWEAHWSSIGFESQPLVMSRNSFRAAGMAPDPLAREEHQITIAGLLSLYCFWSAYRGSAGSQASIASLRRWLLNALPASIVSGVRHDQLCDPEDYAMCTEGSLGPRQPCAHLQELMCGTTFAPMGTSIDCIVDFALAAHALSDSCGAKQAVLMRSQLGPDRSL